MSDLLGYVKPEGNNIGAAMVGGGGKRREHDFYPTEPGATIALVEQYMRDFCGWEYEFDQVGIHEPSCGDGAISKVLERYGFKVFSTDLVDRGYGQGGVDYLQSTETREWVITNPPFEIAEAFIRKALADGAARVYMLLKSTYFHAAGRIDLFDNTPVSRIIPMTWRLDFTGQGSPTMECCWFEWEAGYKGEPKYGPLLRRPGSLEKSSEKCEKTIDLFE